MEKLDACIRNHDKEIEKMCNFHHQGFVDAITELLKVRTDAEKLKVRNLLKFYLSLLSLNYSTLLYVAYYKSLLNVLLSRSALVYMFGDALHALLTQLSC